MSISPLLKQITWIFVYKTVKEKTFGTFKISVQKALTRWLIPSWNIDAQIIDQSD